MASARNQPPSCLYKSTEISYNIRHFEEHGKATKEPWSCRQCGIYQNYTFRGNFSTWILIKLPKNVQDYLERCQGEEQGHADSSERTGHPLRLHIVILNSYEKNWRVYLGFLRKELLQMVSAHSLFKDFSKAMHVQDERIYFPKKYCEYDVEFSHSRCLANLRLKLMTAIAVLESNLDIISTLSELSRGIHRQGGITTQQRGEFDMELRQCSGSLEGHIRKVKSDLKASKDIRLLVLNTFIHR